MTTRQCGSCAACCQTSAVVALDKPEQTPCAHLTRGGTRRCGIYATRPAECSDGSCAWLLGMGTSADRPDKLGIVFDATTIRATRIFQAREVWTGAAKGGRATALIGQMSRTQVVLIMHRDGRRTLLGPAVAVMMLEGLTR